MKKIILRRLELLQNGSWTKEETLKNILDLIEDYSIRLLIFADEPRPMKLGEIYKEFNKYYNENFDINGNKIDYGNNNMD